MFTRRLRYVTLFSLMVLFVAPLSAQDDVNLPANRAVITPENVAQLQPLGRYGTGELSDAFAWSPDASTLAIGGATGIWLYASDALTTPFDFIPTERYVDRLGFSPDGHYLAYRTRGYIVHLLEYSTRTELQTFADAQAFTFHPEMPLFVVGTDQYELVEDAGAHRNVSRITLWDTELRQTIKIFEFAMHMWGRNNIVNMDFSADGSLFAVSWQSGAFSSCDDRTSEVIWWNFDDILSHTEAELSHYENTFRKTLPDLYGVKFHPAQTMFASTLIDIFLPPIGDVLVLVDPLTGERTEYDFDPSEPTGSPHKSIAGIAFDAAGDQVHVLIESNINADDEIYMLNLDDGAVSQAARFSGQITGYAPLPFPTAAMHGQYRIATASGDLVSIGAAQVWLPNEINDDGSAFLTRDFDGVRRLWTLSAAGEVEEIPLPSDYQEGQPYFGRTVNDGQTAETFSPNNTRLFRTTTSVTGCGGDNRQVLLHDAQTGALVTTIQLRKWVSGQGGSEHYSFSPDSRMLLISTASGTDFYEADSGEIIATIDGLDSSQLRFNADGTLLIAARDDGTVTLWGIPTDTAE